MLRERPQSLLQWSKGFFEGASSPISRPRRNHNSHQNTSLGVLYTTLRRPISIFTSKGGLYGRNRSHINHWHKVKFASWNYSLALQMVSSNVAYTTEPLRIFLDTKHYLIHGAMNLVLSYRSLSTKSSF